MTRLAAVPLVLGAWLAFLLWLLRRDTAPAGIGDPDDTAVIDMSEVPPSQLIPGRWTA